MRVPPNRRGFLTKKAEPHNPPVVAAPLPASSIVIYYQSKLSHSGVTHWKTFEGFPRKIHENSKRNLLNQFQKELDALPSATNSTANGEPVQNSVRTERHLNQAQSRKIKSLSNKLCYYSRVRSFVSKKTGSYKFKVAFLTLTAPVEASPDQSLKAFEYFLDYLRRTANCHFVWKKELGETGKALHFHILVNNFIPYYLVSWKWKRLLIAQGVRWTVNDKGEDTNAHTRIELPRSRKLIAHYIGKYMSKAYELPREYGYISGHSAILTDLKEPRYIEGDLPKDELLALADNFRTIRGDFVTHCSVDLRRVQYIAPTVYYWFLKQFNEFQDLLTLPQKYWYV